ncbi:hypothetical protein, partial [Gluconacetobacter johannae]
MRAPDIGQACYMNFFGLKFPGFLPYRADGPTGIPFFCQTIIPPLLTVMWVGCRSLFTAGAG